MKKILITGIALIVIIVGGVYLAGRTSVSDDKGTSTDTPVATTTDNSTDTKPGTTGGTTVVPEEGEVTLGVGETAAFRGILVTPVAVVEDSRCPVDVQCIQAGTVRVKLEIKSGLGTATKTVKLGDFITTEAQKVTFISVAPEKRSTKEIKSSEYRFTVKIEKRSSSSTQPSETTDTTAGSCYVGGCAGQICSAEKDVVSTCEYREVYACYKTAKCERQASGQCGWTETAALKACIANAS
jgi:eight-cysteine-cluster-containing protein